MHYLFLLLAPLLAAPVHAQSLKDAFESAWRRSPPGAAEARRLDEAQARREAAASWLRESPSLSAGYKTDQVDRNAGARELELELGLPIALPGDRERALAVGTAEASAVQATLDAERLRVASDVREAYWTLHAARIEREQAQRRVDEVQALAQDVERRVRVGELARVDALQSQAAMLLAQSAWRATDLDVQRATRAFIDITGQRNAPTTPIAEAAAQASDVSAHPLLKLQQTQRDAAEARARQASEVRRDAPELAVRLSRERLVHQARDTSALAPLLP
ncbi:MAG: TolC family protein [Burkholderiaceae bacterium]|nr:TolC family protein [Burkholderiaceae bacterium]